MDVELINRVSECLKSPKTQLNEFSALCKDLVNFNVKINCGSCITEGVMLLSNWLKKQGIGNEYFGKAVNMDYELKPIILFVQVYDCGDTERQKELDACLRINKESGHFFKVIEITERLTYSSLFGLTKEYSDCINVIANSDIYFNETILLARFMSENSCVALSRWDYVGDKMAVLFNRKDSQDAWIFNGEANGLQDSNFCLGVPGCDNRIAHDIKRAGYSVINPSKTIHAIHLHLTGDKSRTYDEKTPRVPEPYHFIHPHF